MYFCIWIFPYSFTQTYSSPYLHSRAHWGDGRWLEVEVAHIDLLLLSFLWTGIKEGSQKVQAVKKLIQNLPKPNHDTMKLLFSHLHRYVYRRMERQITEWGQLLRKWWYCPLSHFFKSKQIQESSQVHRCWCHIVKLNSTFLTLLLYLYIWCLLLITEVLTVDLNMSTFCLTSIDSVGASTSCLKPTTTNVLINTHCAWLLSECSCSGSYKLCTHGSQQLSCPAVFQSSGLLQEEPDVHSGHRHRVRPNADVARAGRRKHGGQHGLPEPDRRVHPHREPTNLQPGQEVKRPGSEVDRIIWRTHIYTSKLKNNQVPSEMLSFKQETEAVSCFVEK